MIWRKSSGSSLRDKAVEPTRSTNITVNCLRSGVAVALACCGCGVRAGGIVGGSVRIARSILRLNPKREAELTQVLFREVGQYIECDVIRVQQLRDRREFMPLQPSVQLAHG